MHGLGWGASKVSSLRIVIGLLIGYSLIATDRSEETSSLKFITIGSEARRAFVSVGSFWIGICRVVQFDISLLVYIRSANRYAA
jgi:hypothetical protein